MWQKNWNRLNYARMYVKWRTTFAVILHDFPTLDVIQFVWMHVHVRRRRHSFLSSLFRSFTSVMDGCCFWRRNSFGRRRHCQNWWGRQTQNSLSSGLEYAVMSQIVNVYELVTSRGMVALLNVIENELNDNPNLTKHVCIPPPPTLVNFHPQTQFVCREMNYTPRLGDGQTLRKWPKLREEGFDFVSRFSLGTWL